MTGSRTYFETVAPKWDTLRRGFFSETVRERAFEAAGAVAGKIAADIGAGSGFVTEGILKRGLRVIAVDRSEAMLEEMRRKFGEGGAVDYRIGEAEALPLEDGPWTTSLPTCASTMSTHPPQRSARWYAS